MNFEDEAEDPMAFGGLGITIRGVADDDKGEDADDEENEASSPSEGEEEDELDDLKRLERLEREVKLDEPEIDLGENDDGDTM